MAKQAADWKNWRRNLGGFRHSTKLEEGGAEKQKQDGQRIKKSIANLKKKSEQKKRDHLVSKDSRHQLFPIPASRLIRNNNKDARRKLANIIALL